MAPSQTGRRRPSPRPLARLMRPWLPEPRGAAPGSQLLLWRQDGLLQPRVGGNLACLMPLLTSQLMVQGSACPSCYTGRLCTSAAGGRVPEGMLGEQQLQGWTRLKGLAVVHMSAGAHKRRQSSTACCNCTVGLAQEHSTRWVAGSALPIRDCSALHDALVRCTKLSSGCHLLQGLDNLVGKKADGPKAALRVDEVSPPAARCASVCCMSGKEGTACLSNPECMLDSSI